MNVLGMFDKLDDIIYAPVNALSKWIEEPLKKFEANRQLTAEKQKAILEAECKRQEALLEADKRRWDAEIDDMIHMKEIERNKQILDAIIEYKRSMDEDVLNIAHNLNQMQLVCYDATQTLLESKFKVYKNLQKEAMNEQYENLNRINQDYPNDEKLRENLQNQVITQTNDIIEEAKCFIKQLRVDIQKITDSNIKTIEEAREYVEMILNQTMGAKNIGINSPSMGSIEEKN